MDDRQHLGGLRVVGRIALATAALATFGLVAMVFMLDLQAGTYGETSVSLTLGRRQLPWLMIAVGLGLAALTGLTTWLITLYSSFRVAGPLYRFTRNVELAADAGGEPMIRIRRGDYLQADATALETTVAGLYRYHAELERMLDAIEQSLDGGEPLDESVAALATMLARART